MLTEMECRQAKPREKVYSLSDGNGLFLEIRPSGAKYWIGQRRSGNNYRYGNKVAPFYSTFFIASWLDC